MEDHDDDIGNTSDWVSQKSKQQKSCCCSRWKLVIIFLVILTSLCLGSIGFGVYLMLRFQDLSVELERAVLRNNSLQNRFQIEKSEEEVERLFDGHEKHNDKINNMTIMLKNYTVIFNENIGKLQVNVSDLTKLYENQVKIQRDIQTLIETNNRNTRLKIDEIVRTQNSFQHKLSDILIADKDDHDYPDCSVKLLNEMRSEYDVDMKSNGGKQTKNLQRQICTCVWIKNGNGKFCSVS
ncbi:unnamed protein product [Mytilus edulis]|uniref:Uncharacterized protein n=1 Tax=Mytilus edulis TaxID=6550 RepID=A0A8S3SYF4_MYTED|nr:unnamed protein product [Mytilus edulis]